MLRIRSIAVALAVFVAAPAAAIPLSDIDASTVIASLDGNATFTDFLAIDPPRSSQFHEITATDTGFLIEATGGTSLISSDDLLLYWGVSFSATNDVAGRRALIRVTGEAADPGRRLRRNAAHLRVRRDRRAARRLPGADPRVLRHHRG